MRTFFKIFFACLLAIGVSFFLFFMLLAGGLSSGDTKLTKVEANSVLNLTLKGEITDRAYNNPFRNLTPSSALLGSISNQSTIGLFELKDVLKAAKKDDHIKGVYLNLDDITAPPATLFEINKALEDFKNTGKFIYAYSNNCPELNLMLNNTADFFYMNPVGGCEFDGFAMQLEYMKGLYDKLGVEFKVFHVGEFKSAIEGYRRKDMSDEDRMQRTELLNDISSEFLNNLKMSTGIEIPVLSALQNNLSVFSAASAVKNKLADGLKYEDEVLDAIKLKMGYKKSDELNMISYAKYNSIVKDKISSTKENKIAVLYAEGAINDGKEDEGTIGRDAYVKLIREIKLDKTIKGVVLRVNSPGGSAFASEQIYHELLSLKNEKPLVVSMGDYAASGGYYISAAANKIIAQPNTITGSIGIFGIIPNLRKALNDKLGITFDEVKTSEHANYLNLTNDWDDIEMNKMQHWVEDGYATFIDRVAAGRKMDTAAVNKVARGRVWTGQDALAIGLVDEIGGMELAVKRVKEIAKIKEADLVTYPKEKTLMESIVSSILGDEGNTQAKLLKNLTPQLLYLKQLESIQQLGVLQYAMPVLKFK